jgi:hypothetical protein
LNVKIKTPKRNTTIQNVNIRFETISHRKKGRAWKETEGEV